MLGPLAHNKTSFAYKFFGLLIRSNLPLPRIPFEENPVGKCDLALNLGIAPYPKLVDQPGSEELTYASPDTNEDGEPLLRIWNVQRDAFVRMMFDDGTQFWLDQSNTSLWATWPESLSLENAAAYLLGPVLGVVLRLRGVVCLHASAVSIEDHAVAFVGPPGAGKSTTAAACSKMGHAVLSDDVLALEERQGSFYAFPAHPQLRLWPESAQLLYGCTERLSRFNPNWDKLGLRPGELGTRFEDRALPLSAIYVLGDRRSDPGPSLEPLRPQAALMSLVADTYGNSVLDRGM